MKPPPSTHTCLPLSFYSSTDNLSSTSTAPNQRRKRTRVCKRPERIDDRNKSERLTKRTRERQKNPTNSESECFQPAELLLLDRAGIQEPLSQKGTHGNHELRFWSNSRRDCRLLHGMQSIRKSIQLQIIPLQQSSKKMFSILKPPDGNANSAKPLHPQLLKQYDLSQLIPESSEFRLLFQNVLLASNGVLLHISSCKNKAPADTSPLSISATNRATPVYT